MDEFSTIISNGFLADEVTEEVDTELFGIRCMFYHATNPTQHKTVLLPYLSYDLERAERMRHLVVTEQRQLMYIALSRIISDPTEVIQWIALGAKIVPLAEIPF